MSTLKTHNLQSPDASSVNIAMAPNAGMVVTGISTFSGDVFVGSGITCHASAGIVSANVISSGPISLLSVNTGGRVRTTSGFLTIQSVLGTVIEDVDGNNQIKANNDSSVQLYFNANEKLATTNTGVVISGICTATSFKGDGSQLSNLPASAPVGGSASNKVFFENDKVVSVNYQITSTKNAMTAGPVTINSGIGVTVPSGCAWTIV